MRVRSASALLFALAVLAGTSCDKVPITNINAGFTLADAVWFEDEQTLFLFYSVTAQQGIRPESQVELSYLTKTGTELKWTALTKLTPIHHHEPVLCAQYTLCGSMSVKVVDEPIRVGLRLRYHRDGELALNAFVKLNIIGSGPAHTNRSLLVYGVFNEKNDWIEWRSRNQFPNLRNEEVTALGLRRQFKITEEAYGQVPLPEKPAPANPFDPPDGGKGGGAGGGGGTGFPPGAPPNPYSYAFAPKCPNDVELLGWPGVETIRRAVFDPDPLPVAAVPSNGVCALSTVVDAKGTFSARVLARKNPEVRPAFPAVHSPIRTNTRIRFLLKPCAMTISQPHLEMQINRLVLGGPIEICIDDWRETSFSDTLANSFRSAVDINRLAGKDMVIEVALHHSDTTGKFGEAVEAALMKVLPPEAIKSSPRVSGAFVFDSFAYSIKTAQLRRLALWCPAKINLKPTPDDLDLIPGASEQGCAVQPDRPDLLLGPFKFANLPILPTRAQYLTFIGKYSEAQAGSVNELEFLSPERTPISENVNVGDFAVATFFNDELLTAADQDAFSFCAGADTGSDLVVFRIGLIPDPIPLSLLPQVQSQLPQGTYQLGLLWQFPMLVRMKYTLTVAGAITGFGLTIPFGISSPGTQGYGAAQWQLSQIELGKTLKQCTRFCDHATFDDKGVFNVGSLFRETYASQCYRPLYPSPDDQGFPLDP